MIRGPAGCLRIDPAELKLGQIEFVDKDVDCRLARALLSEIEPVGGTQQARLSVHVGTPHAEVPVFIDESIPNVDVTDPVFLRTVAKDIIEEADIHVADVLGGRQSHPERRNTLAF
jgi:hypothetical protein